MPVRLIQANKDPNYQIKESDQYSWHVLITRVTVDKNNPKLQTRNSFVQIFDTAMYNRIFRPERLGSKAQNYKAACLIDESRVIHDPELVHEVPYEGEQVEYRVVKPRAPKKK